MPNVISSFERTLLVGQGTFYLATGLWPNLDRKSFETVTGPKTDFWLVRTVGALVAVIGAAMLVAARNGRAGGETRLLGFSSAAALAAVDATHAARGRISKVYWLDAVVETALAAGWLAASRRRGQPNARLEILTGEQQPD